MTHVSRRVPTRTALRRAHDYLQAHGLPVKAVRVCVSGDILLLTEAGGAPPPEAELDLEIQRLIDEETD